MYQIDFKSKNEKRYKRYLGLGNYDWEVPFNYHLPNEGQNPLSLSEFNKQIVCREPSANTMEIVNALLHEYNENTKDYFEDVYGKERFMAFESNYDLISQFYDKWYEDVLFKKLDLVYLGRDDILKEITNNDGNATKIFCKDGSVFKVLDPDEGWHQYYVLESEYNELAKDYETLIKCFNSSSVNL